LAYYRSADIFCFPSVREFGGAVVLEAMAAGLPCIVANHGGIAEYVTSETGFKIEPLCREHIIGEVVQKVKTLIENRDLYRKFSRNAIRRAKNFVWDVKAEALYNIYEGLVC
jgi:glycosyltransferase involved in cell wall biosynthesis